MEARTGARVRKLCMIDCCRGALCAVDRSGCPWRATGIERAGGCKRLIILLVVLLVTAINASYQHRLTNFAKRAARFVFASCLHADGCNLLTLVDHALSVFTGDGLRVEQPWLEIEPRPSPVTGNSRGFLSSGIGLCTKITSHDTPHPALRAFALYRALVHFVHLSRAADDHADAAHARCCGIILTRRGCNPEAPALRTNTNSLLSLPRSRLCARSPGSSPVTL